LAWRSPRPKNPVRRPRSPGRPGRGPKAPAVVSRRRQWSQPHPDAIPPPGVLDHLRHRRDGMVIFYVVFTFARLEIFKMLLGSFFPLALIISGSSDDRRGSGDPDRSCGDGVLRGICPGGAYKQLNFTVVKESVFLTAKTSAMVCWLFVGSSILRGLRPPRRSGAHQRLGLNRWT